MVNNIGFCPPTDFQANGDRRLYRVFKDHASSKFWRSYVEKVTEPSDYAHYDDIPTPEEYPVFGKGLVPRKQAQDIQAQRAKQRYQPFG